MAAVVALTAVDDGAHAEDVLAEVAPDDDRDRALAWFLALGVLRRRSHVDAALRAHLRQPLAALEPAVRATLRVGAYERLFARTETHAAVHQAVEVARAVRAGRASGLINAVLRKVTMPAGLSRAEALDHPAWLVARWDARYGPEATDAWCAANSETPPLVVVGRDADALQILGGQPSLVLSPVEIAGQEVPLALRVQGHRGPITDLPGFEQGHFWIQDAAAVAVADFVGAGPRTRVLDACAAPGGKSFRMASHGAAVTAVDRSRERLEPLRTSAVRLGIELDIHVHDWARGAPDLGQFSHVLVDALCTGLGTVGRHPEIRWRRQEPDLELMASRQQPILASAAAHVAPGGTLVYAVCSPEPEEGQQVIDAFLATEDGKMFAADAILSTAPPTAGEDAHFAARLVRGGGPRP